MEKQVRIPYGRQDISEDDVRAVRDVLVSDFLTQGPKIPEFEKAFADYVGAKYAVAVSNGTAALHLSALALGVKEGSRVITTPITFAATANCVRFCGGEVKFVDIDSANATICLDLIERTLEAEPAGTYQGIIPVDFAGYPVDLERLSTIADKHNLWIIEDACHAPGGFFTNISGEITRCGSGRYADLSIFSFHPVKHIACGEGGMITTDSPELYRKIVSLRTHGITKEQSQLREKGPGWYYEMQELGYNYRLTEIQAALGVSQLKRESQRVARRRALARNYDFAFQNKIATLDTSPLGHAFHLYVILTEKRDELHQYLQGKGIFSQVHYIPVPYHPYYQKRASSEGRYPRAQEYYRRCLSLPMFPTLTDEEQQYVIDCVLEFSSTE